MKGKLFKSNVLSQMHKQSEDSYKLSEILVRIFLIVLESNRRKELNNSQAKDGNSKA